MDILYGSPPRGCGKRTGSVDGFIHICGQASERETEIESGLIAEDRLEVGVCGRFSPDYRLNRFASLEGGEGGVHCFPSVLTVHHALAILFQFHG